MKRVVHCFIVVFALTIIWPVHLLANSNHTEESFVGHFIQGQFWDFLGEPGTTYEILTPELTHIVSQKDGNAEFQMDKKGDAYILVCMPDARQILCHCVVGGMELLPIIEKEAALVEQRERMASQEKASQSLSKDYAERVLSLVNQERTQRNIPPLFLSSELMEAAATRAEEITRLFSHTRPNGAPCHSLIKDGAYTVGENIAAGHASPEETVQQWMSSSGHRANILNADYTEMGVGFVYREHSDYHYYWVQLFRRPMSHAIQRR